MTTWKRPRTASHVSVYNVNRERGELTASCRGQYLWVNLTRRETREDYLPGVCYRVDPITGERTPITKRGKD